MSILIDELLKGYTTQTEVGGKWYIAKPLNKIPFFQRLRDAKNVFYGYSRAYHYFEDEAETWGEIK